MKKKSITILLLIILSGLLLSRCGNILEKTEDDSTIKQPSSKLASGDYFSLTDKTAHTYSYVLHKQATTSTECAIAKTVIGSADKDEEILWDNAQDMLCILDVEELDLFYHGVSFEINVPADVCEYVRYRPYYYYLDTPGISNTTYTKHVVADGSNCTLSNQNDGEPYFLYDQQGPEGALNCDTGTSTAFIYSHTGTDGSACDAVDAGALSGIPQDTSYAGGSWENCESGPGAGVENHSNYYFAAEGMVEKWSYDAPMSKGFSSNVYLANYTKQCDSETNTTTLGEELYALGEESALTNEGTTNAVAQSYGRYLSGPRKLSNVYYSWECLDKAYDVKARIRLQIREWNRMFDEDDTTVEISKFIPQYASTGVDGTALMDAWGNESSGIDYWNDIFDWDDFSDLNNGYTSQPEDLDDSTCDNPATPIFSFPGE
ncbi:MAG: hypothetical protein A2504_12755 [Bdellovibrionales bacterium RIFOXYD12_FULL_39_22]|nr:MAG: hypothetical protein A2385_03840 [Bdellovibrionales bacterium RIFOXYB1_FULL_39_21]OFZ40484.1 MAG: hypothetical protein A2485_02705 [Bdellovibrionales bacterium RIFOXYC12_FULL_39_17]OFZ49967.1 MAG: hypothetical protein A2404_02040 [Bdellovibrionales bacterium RIFOXYC1_FULL_39_130]OFZ77609.1 MAG: hypothetical protein A2560_04600 [Bdellovibrionales bacterium RIFOXYD1_FULL_39_84]OFZ96063.1 MAG: hypothetical protein A2504_12755 [Bdellovibrionales bacterium RIFOXYD12_FULL_39_22]HLE10648.1 hy